MGGSAVGEQLQLLGLYAVLHLPPGAVHLLVKSPCVILFVLKRRHYETGVGPLDTTYEPWTMRHDTQEVYPPLRCEPPAVYMLRREGRVWIPGGIVPLKDALGPQPKNATALRALLALPGVRLLLK